ncbi:MAG: hypothetical protein K9I82_08230 [Chitinophagaceae bacterium]|nr:hypothetical protein [Chitinophagaceae bacterium]
MQKNTNLIFYFPYKKVGGVSILFLETAKFLSNKFQIILVDFLDGYMGRRIPEFTLHKNFEDEEGYPNNSILILQSTFIWRLKDLNKFTPETKILFWNLHPDNFAPLKIDKDINKSKFKNFIYSIINILFKYSYNYNKKYISLLEEHNSIWFMDESNYSKTQEYYPKNKFLFNLLPCFFSKKKTITHKQIDKILNFVTIGRLVDFKIHILNHLIYRLNNLSEVKFKLTIIGEGEEKPAVLNFINQLDLKYEISFIDELNNLELGEYIYDNCDILFAMGLSSLEGASRSIPTFLLDYSFKPIEFNYKFKLIFENTHFNLASEIKINHLETSSTFENTINEILNNYTFYSNKCYNYWLMNHSENIFFKNFDLAISSTSLTIGHIISNKFHQPDIITRLYYYLKNKPKIGNNNVHGFRYPSN